MNDTEIVVSISKESLSKIELLTAECTLLSERSENLRFTLDRLQEEIKRLPWWLRWTIIFK